MKSVLKKYNLEIGQVIPLVVLMMFAIIAMVALILDGGAVMSNRRTAQAAADAGALAGAQRTCFGFTDAETVARTYATNNGATDVDIPLLNESKITVVATVENDSFFARIFGETSLTAVANATAGCYSLMGRGVIPVAFHCEKETIGGAISDDMYDCIMLGLDWETELKPLLDGQPTDIDGKTYSMDGTQIVDAADPEGVPPINKMYIIMDDDKLCISEGGTIQCDISDPPDGIEDLKFGGQRGFLYLDNVNSLTNFIMKGPKTDINIRSHKWLSGDPGVQASIYNQMQNYGYVGQVVLLPVFNHICKGDPRVDTTCMDAAHESPWPPEPSWFDDFSAVRGGKDNYHILDFAPFYISCISTSTNRCKGYDYAYNNVEGLNNNANIIEGFFVTGYDDVLPDSTRTCEINLGSCVISLSD